MKTSNFIENIHPDAPRRLVTAVLHAGSERKFAGEVGINQSYVSQLLHRGIEPGNPEIRVKLFLPARKRQLRQPKPEEWPGQRRVTRAIRAMHRKTTLAFKERMKG